MPEWNFSYPVTKDLELVAQWVKKMPISTDPVAYLDKDGNQQVCNEYTVLTSNTADSILDLDDKWYDLPAGWYVVKGVVTITPRLDTHGAVNQILLKTDKTELFLGDNDLFYYPINDIDALPYRRRCPPPCGRRAG